MCFHSNVHLETQTRAYTYIWVSRKLRMYYNKKNFLEKLSSNTLNSTVSGPPMKLYHLFLHFTPGQSLVFSCSLENVLSEKTCSILGVRCAQCRYSLFWRFFHAAPGEKYGLLAAREACRSNFHILCNKALLR